ncbi:hypothetical protein C4J81_04245 [Deltaproteobacteria bacterium Smac51]|nr:hypothetical protein C4J81_04245 [Deltaproteobacteria bacterium Smac51]
MKIILRLLSILAVMAALGSGSALAQEQKDLGALTPDEALAYMKSKNDLLIVDVAAERWYGEKHFEGAVNIPIESLNDAEEKKLYQDLPGGRPVLLHCRLGMIVPGAYRNLKQLRPDIPEISYIAGKPPFDEYNSWLKSRK